MQRCPKCRREALTEYRFCPQCGANLRLERNRGTIGNQGENGFSSYLTGLFQQVRDWCFSQSPSISGNHDKFTSMMADYLRQKGWQVIREYEVKTHPYVKVMTGEIGERGGLVDVCGHLKGKKIVLEYDRCSHIRFKSVEKLFFSDADMAIGVVRGKQNQKYLVKLKN